MWPLTNIREQWTCNLLLNHLNINLKSKGDFKKLLYGSDDKKKNPHFIKINK